MKIQVDARETKLDLAHQGTLTTIHRSFLDRHVSPESDGLLLTITCDAHVDTSLDAVAQANRQACNFAAAFAAAKAFKALKLLVRSGSYLWT